MNKQYSSLASVYDALNADFDYKGYAEYIVSEIKKYEKTNTSLVLDLGCGTGKMTFELRERGYDMTGIDISPEMLSEAKRTAEKKKADSILWLCQSMTDFELYGTVDACICTLDGINYLTDIKEVEKCFTLVHNYLIPDGVFVFDINTKYKFENVYANNAYVLENEDVLCAWQNEYNEKTKKCKFYLDIFKENEDGTYNRFSEVQTEKCYSEKTIEKLLQKCGFEILKEGKTSPEKKYFTARAKK